MEAIANAHPLKRLARYILKKELLQARKNYLALDRKYCAACEREVELRVAMDAVGAKSTNAIRKHGQLMKRDYGV